MRLREKALSTPCAIKDWTTCFFACGFPLGGGFKRIRDKEPDAFCSSSSSSSSSARVPSGTMVFNPNKSHHANDTALCDYEKANQKKASIPSSAQRESSFADEDYIIFCFTEDGSIHKVKDDIEEIQAPNHNDHFEPSSKKTIRTKLMRAEHRERVSRCSHDLLFNEEETDIYIAKEANSTICCKEGKGKWSTKSSPADAIRGAENKMEACEMVGVEPSESTQSDGSSSSFAFPELNWEEEIGSPKQLHKPEPLLQQ